MHFTTSIVALFAAFAIALPAADPELQNRGSVPDPGTVSIQTVSTGGSGCPKGTVTATISGDGQTVSLIFDNYVAQYGPGTKPSDSRKNCNVQMKLFYPQGWSYTVATTDFRGYIQQEKSCHTNLGVTNWFSGDQKQMGSGVTVSGALAANYLRTTQVATDTIVWAACGAVGPLFNANSQVVVGCSKSSESALATVDVQDTKFEIKYHVQWKKCN